MPKHTKQVLPDRGARIAALNNAGYHIMNRSSDLIAWQEFPSTAEYIRTHLELKRRYQASARTRAELQAQLNGFHAAKPVL